MRILLIGATGDVGRGILHEALATGHSVTAVARTAADLEGLEPHPAMRLQPGDIGTAEGAMALARTACADKPPDAVVVAVSVASNRIKLTEITGEDLSAAILGTLQPHLHAAHAFGQLLPEGSVFLGLGGGTADVVIPGLAPVSMAQAALRVLYRHFACERSMARVIWRELLIRSMVNGGRKREIATDDWLTDREIGRHVLAILTDPAAFAGPILTIAAREDIGRATG
ncbi:NAD(P)H-binding protein [Pararhodobacter marinus]|uniref:NAD(P)H-binding protein n=1 Tax=Pararhodobacter marinus TaxID=2184063 RepID=UPI0035188327